MYYISNITITITGILSLSTMNCVRLVPGPRASTGTNMVQQPVSQSEDIKRGRVSRNTISFYLPTLPTTTQHEGK